ncbi:NFACT family protein [bacterium]|nr:NFACT family protein [bacterium]
MDYFTICAQRKQTGDSFAGRKVETVRLHGNHAVFIGFEGDRALKLSGVPGMPYLHTVEKRYIPSRNARDWHLSKFAGTVLESVGIIPGDRVLFLRFDSGMRLVFELTGRYANIVAVNPDGIIAGSTRVITGRISGYREIRPGVKYIPPPAREYIDLVWGVLPELEKRLFAAESAIEEALAVSVCSGSRPFAREAVFRCGLDPSLKPGDLSPDDTLKLFRTVAVLVDRIEKGGEGGTVIMGADGLPRDVFPLPMESAGVGDTFYKNLDDAVIRYSLDRERGLEFRQLRHTITSALNREEKRILSTIGKIDAERGGESEAELLDRHGNTILANPHRIKRGMTSATLDDPYSPGGGQITVELDPALDGPGNAERFFQRARKLRAASKHAEERIASLRRRLETLRAESSRAESLEDLKELRTIADRYVRTGEPGRAYEAEEPFPRRFVSASGLEIIVGRNDSENDELVRWARKNDIWLHAQGVGGSHVILRSPGKQNPDHRSLEEAASVAAYYSKAKTSAVVPVVWTAVKYVVKRKGQGPGQVTYTREKVLFVEPGIRGKEGENKE